MRVIMVLLLCCLMFLMGCGAVSQGFRGQPDLSDADRQDIKAQYIGKTAWLKRPVYKGEFEDEYARAMVPEAGPRKKAYEVELAAWERVEIKDILFGSGFKNFITVVDSRGKAHQGAVHIPIPSYTAMEKSQPDFAERVRSDYEYSISQVLSLVNRDEYLKDLEDRFGKEFAMAILDHRVAIGMPREAVLESWGRPSDINRTITESVTSEQWVYGTIPNAKFVYLEDGLVTSLQD
jgi:hypothetical protein